MENILRKNTVLSLETEELLNKQVALEAKASAKYLAMASWCDGHGYANCATYFYEQSDEERMHMLKIFKYINDMGGNAISPSVDSVKQDYTSLRDNFEEALSSEIVVTRAINQIVDQVKKEKDYSTDQFMQWFVSEQREEEIIARRAVELFDLLGEEKLALFMIDERISGIRQEAAPDPAAE